MGRGLVEQVLENLAHAEHEPFEHDSPLVAVRQIRGFGRESKATRGVPVGRADAGGIGQAERAGGGVGVGERRRSGAELIRDAAASVDRSLDGVAGPVARPGERGSRQVSGAADHALPRRP